MAVQSTGSPVSSSRFEYSPQHKLFMADASDLGRGLKLFQRVYPDAADVGFPLRSERTGVCAWFAFVREDRNADNEITGWVFHPTDEAVRANPALAAHRVLVIND